MHFSDIAHALATLGVETPHIYYSTDLDALFSATYYHPDRRGERWVFRAESRQRGGIEITPLYETRPGVAQPMKQINIPHALASYGLHSPQIYYSTATEALLSATYYEPRCRGERWVIWIAEQEVGGVKIKALYQA
jgi:hypothetical protein